MANRGIVAGGWSWYTGAAGWMYRAGFEGRPGFPEAGAGLSHHALRATVLALV